MAAITYPSSQPLRQPVRRPAGPRRPALRLVQGGLAVPAPVAVAPGVYARRRVVALVLAAVVAMVVVVAVQAVAAGLLVSPAPSSPAVPGARPAAGAEVHIVQPGETLWSIASERTPAGGDVQATVDRLVERNGGAPALQAGQHLLLD